MAQSGFTPLQIYSSSTASNTPLAANLSNTAQGAELAINIADGKLFYKDSGGVVQVLATKSTGSIGGANTQIQFNNSGALGGSANLTWNGTVLGTTGFTASSDSTFTSTGALTISNGTTAQRPASPTVAMLRYNSTISQFEGYSGSSPAWNPVGGSVISNDTSTATNLYPLFANATSGTATTVYTSNAKYLYKPSTGDLTASQHVSSNGIFVNSQTVSTSYTIPTGSSAMSAGPLTVGSGVVITVSSGSRFVII